MQLNGVSLFNKKTIKKASEEAKIQQNAHVHQNFITTDRLKAGSAGEATTSDGILMRLGVMPYFCVSSP